MANNKTQKGTVSGRDDKLMARGKFTTGLLVKEALRARHVPREAIAEVEAELARRGRATLAFEIFEDGHIVDYPVGAVAVVGNSLRPLQRSTDSRQAEILSAARERGRISAAGILAGPEMLTAEQMATRLGLSTMSISNKRKSHELLGLVGAKARGHRYPEWQLDENDKPFAALPAIYDRLGGTEWSVYRYLTTRHAELDGMTGIDALRAGRDEEVIDVAESVVRSFT